MKNLSLFVSAFALLASSASAQTINCGTLPSCDSLGYTDTVAQCPKSVNGEDLAVKCPFDTLKGKCIYEAAIGQIGYFTKAPNANSGWLLCDGKTYGNSTYPQLAARIGTQFGGTSGNTFNVPDYRGFFLRVYASGSYSSYVRSDFSTYAKGAVNSSFTNPQPEGLPNITGEGGWFDKGSIEQENGKTPLKDRVKGAFYLSSTYSYKGNESTDNDNAILNFDASRSNSIYGAQSGVTPPNMAVYAYIYAGKVVK